MPTPPDDPPTDSTPPRRFVPPRDKRRNDLHRQRAAACGEDDPVTWELLDQAARRDTELNNEAEP